jgi:hypothetical protein
MVSYIFKYVIYDEIIHSEAYIVGHDLRSEMTSPAFEESIRRCFRLSHFTERIAE